MLVLHTSQRLPHGISLIAEALDIGLLRATDLAEAQKKCAASRPDIVLLPALFSGQPTLPFMQTCLERTPDVQAVMLVERDQINEAAEAMRVGILDCLFLPFTAERLTKTLSGALGRRGKPIAQAKLERILQIVVKPPQRVKPEAISPPETKTADSDCIQGTTAPTRVLKTAIEAACLNRLPVVLLGEAGCGKSHCAALIHAESDGSNAPFHKLDCAALTLETLPADMSDPTTRATFFLDELTDLAPRVQARLVRLIGDDGLPQARLISATTHDPVRAITSGLLRRDLFYRLCVSEIRVPPLRARGADILLIAQGKLRQYALLEGVEMRDFSPEAAARLLAYSWPGNIRQLMNVCRNLVLTHATKGAQVVEVEMLPPEIATATQTGAGILPDTDEVDFLASFFRGQSLAGIERSIIEAVIHDNGGSVTRAARVLEVAPSTLYRKREQWMAKDSARDQAKSPPS